MKLIFFYTCSYTYYILIVRTVPTVFTVFTDLTDAVFGDGVRSRKLRWTCLGSVMNRYEGIGGGGIEMCLVLGEMPSLSLYPDTLRPT